MKKLYFFVLFTMISLSLFGQNIIFLHHSTGAGVYNGGNGLPQWFTDYNTHHSSSYVISELSYPDYPYEWANYPYDYWNLWVNTGQCNNTNEGIRCLDWFTSNYNVIIFKHCFPGAGIVADIGSPDVTSSIKSIENYKLQYRALRALMDSYPNNKFIIWTLAPLHRNATDTESSARAREFVNWVKNDWLTEDSKTHPNIYVFDFFGYTAESNPAPARGKVNCLKYDYESDHGGDDSHPNETANSTIMPIFGQFIVDVIKNNVTYVNDLKGFEKLEIKFYPNPAKNYIKVEGTNDIEFIEILDIYGKSIQKFSQPNHEIDVSWLPKGTYIVRASSNAKFISRLLIID
jgi:hypothetical protein